MHSLLVILFLCCSLSAALPRAKREFINESVHNYLIKYGYLNHSMVGAGALRTEESVRKAIKGMQQFAGLPVTGTVDAATAKLLSTPRCGLPDAISSSPGRRKRYSLQGQSWHYTNLTWSLRTQNLRHLNSYDVRVVFAKALDVWARHSKLTFTEIDNDRADILIYFHRGEHGDNFPFDGKGQVLAHAFFPGTGRGGDAHFDEEEVWLTRENENRDEGTSLFHVAAHEFGHSLGLQHSGVQGALMYPWYQGMQNGFNYELPEDDRLAIQSLYGAHTDKQWDRIPTTPSTTTTTTTYRPRYWPPPDRPRQSPSNRPYSPRKPMHPDHKHHHHKNSKYPDKPRGYPYSPDKYPWKPEMKPQRPESSSTTTTSTSTEVYPERNPHRRHQWTTKEHPKKPDTCNTTYDSVAVIRREVFIFKDAYFWRIGDSGLLNGYPVEINRMWSGLPRNFTHVDAVYERPDNKIVFFIGKQIFLFTGNTLEPGYPKPLTSLGLPESLERIDGATIWGHNGKTFFFSGNLYWRFDEDLNRVELDYPRAMSMWTGVGQHIDAVFQWKDGKTYFFKGLGFWKFNDLRMRVETVEQTLSAPFWMGCTKHLRDSKQPYVDYRSSKSAILTPVFFLVISTVGLSSIF